MPQVFRVSVGVLFFILFFIPLGGCSGGGGGASGTAPAGTAAGGGTVPPNPTGATLRIEQTLSRAVPQRVTHQRFTGLSASEEVLFGPVTREKAPVIEFTNVDPETTLLHIEYLANGVLVGTGRVSVALSPGEVTVVNDPPFTDVLPTIRSIEVRPGSSSAPLGVSRQFTAVATLTDSSVRDVTDDADWRATPEGIVTVQGGTARGAVLGQVRIVASLEGVEGEASFSVTSAVPTSLKVEPPESISTTGSRRQYRAVAGFSDNSTHDVTDLVVWNADYNQVSFDGSVKGLLQIETQAVSGQSVSVRAMLNSLSASADLTLASYLYTVHAAGDKVVVFSRNAVSGSLNQLSFLQLADVDPSEIAIEPTGRFAYVVNTAGNSVTPLTINPANGGLAAGISLSTGQKPTSITIDPSGRLLVVSNEESDSISTYTIDPTSGALTVKETKDVGDEPWSLDFDSSGSYLYVLNRLSGNISTFSYSRDTNSLTYLRTENGVATNGTELAADPKRPYLYLADYRVDPVNAKAFSINGLTGGLDPLGGADSGYGPWSVRVHPLKDFAYFTNLSGDSLTTFATSPENGSLSKWGEISTGRQATLQIYELIPRGDFSL